ncbi:hypothetical protein ACHAXA_009487 [Cyclostephanos tholiformis]|uniref:Uncharacterized protein n=1 Tax=Cyclostephanos tholiformis TaxID=382380 RepID=A0ABD3R6U7_9STRA
MAPAGIRHTHTTGPVLARSSERIETPCDRHRRRSGGGEDVSRGTTADDATILERNGSDDGSTEAGPSGGTSERTTRLPAILVEITNSPPGLPAGWTSKTYERARRTTGSSRGGRNRFKKFYSPNNNISFRSMKSCKIFIEILEEQKGADGKWNGLPMPTGGCEMAAMAEFKARGHKL